jgi:chromosome segregation ATPase
LVTRQQRGKPAGDDSAQEWLERDLLETKARLHKVEGELAQALKQTYGLDNDLRKLMEALSTTGSVEASLQSFREEVRQLRDMLGKVQDRQSSLGSRMDQIVSNRQAETGRERHDLGLVSKQIEAVSRLVEQQDSRAKAIEEVLRHLEEQVAGARLSNQGVERVIEELSTRLGRTHEATLRLDQQFAQFDAETERLQKGAETMSERMALFLEQLRRALERLDKMEGLAAFPEEAREQMQRAALERDLLSQRVSALERLVTETAERTDEFVQGLSRLDQRSQIQTSDLVALSAQIQDLEEGLKGGLKKVYQTLLRQRRRQSEAMNQEIKELTQGELHAAD